MKSRIEKIQRLCSQAELLLLRRFGKYRFMVLCFFLQFFRIVRSLETSTDSFLFLSRLVHFSPPPPR